MKKRLLIVAFTCIATLNHLAAQCPPAGFPQPGNTCLQAPILCPDLDGYCATINNANTPQAFPSCPGWFLNNDEWFAFFAGSTSISITITPSNCSPGANQGLQGGIYTNCVNTPMDVQCSCTTNPFVLNSNNFVVGQIYYIVLDGCGGNVCDYSVDVTVGSTVSFPPNPPGPITGPLTLCAGATQNYTIANVPAATSYTWSLTPPVGTVTGTGTTGTVNIPATATTQNTQLCVTAGNACQTNPTPSCIDIEIIPRPSATISGSGSICAGTPGNVPLTLTFTGEGPWTFIPVRNGTPLPPVTTNDNPYTYIATLPGTYTLQSVTTSPGNCAGTVSGSSTITTTTIAPVATPTPSTCLLPNGAINLSVTGGTAPYTFSWSNSETTEDLTMIVGGMIYTVTVTSTEGCTTSTTVNLSNSNPPITLTPTITSNTTCNGGNGAITVITTPVGPTYTYEWASGETVNALTGLVPGSYTVTVSAGGACTQTASYVVPNAPNNPSGSIAPTPSTCALPNGNLNLTASGGVAPYTFEWSNGATSEDLIGVDAGPYTVTITGSNGCTATASVNLTNTNPPFTVAQAVVQNTTCIGGNGSIALTPSPAGAYTYQWANGETTSSLTGLEPGSYTVTVSAGGACTNVLTINIANNPNLPSVTLTPTASTCELPNGSVSMSVSGGVAPYTFSWSNGETTQNLTNLPAGPYEVTVTGANGCTRTASVNVTNTNPPITITPTVVQNTTCTGGNGSISLAIAPPSSVYIFVWSNGETTQNISNLEPGSYQVTVQGNGACSQTASINVGNNPSLPTLTATPQQSFCELNNGSITLSVSGGVAPYTFAWDNGASSQNLTGIASGSYEVTVTGANGCTRTLTVNVNNSNPVINVSANVVDNTTCLAIGNGAVSLNVSPPNSYTYIWNTGAVTPGLTGLLPGTYTVTVSAGGACTRELEVTIDDEPNEPQLSSTQVDARCGLSNGSINLSVSGGAPPFTYQWSSGQITQDLAAIPADTYVVTVTGANGCSSIETVAVEDDPVNININDNIVDNTSCISGNGSIALGITPSGTTIAWSTGASTATINNLAPGDYTVTVTSGLTCTEVQTFSVFDASEQPLLTLDVTAAICNLPTGSIDLTVDGGVAPYTYSWSTGQIVPDLVNKLSGTYTVTVTTARGCTAEAEATIPDNDPGLSIIPTIFENTSCTTPNGDILIDVVPGGYSYTYKWSTNSMQQNLLNVGTGIYTVTVTLGSCTVVESFEMVTNAVAPNLAVAGNAAICGNSNGSATANASGGATPYIFKWSNTQNTATATNLAPGTYTVTVTGSNGCSATASVSIPNNSTILDVNGTIIANTSCVAGNGSIVLTVSPSGTYTYLWSNAANTPNITNLVEGNYTVTVTAGPTCSKTATFMVDKSTSDPVVTPAITPDICSQNIGAIDLGVTGGGGGYVFVWSNASATQNLSNIPAGTYTVTVTASNGCTGTAVSTVANNSNTFSLAGAATPLTNCAINNGAANLTITPAGSYQILWNTTAVTEDIVSLVAGTYTVTVTQSGSCTASLSFVVLDERQSPTLANDITAEVCGLANGAITVQTAQGTQPYAYLWATGQITEDLNNIPGGNYSLTVTDANGCTATTAAAVPNNAIAFALNGATAPNTSCGTNNGSIDLDVQPAGSYTYVWSNTAGTEDLSNIDGGTYSVTVSAGGTCTNVATFNVVDNTLSPLVSESVIATLCAKANGSIALNVSGSTTPYVYLWNNGQTSSNLANILAGTYTVTVTGANACTTENTVIVPDNAFAPNISGNIVENTSCTAPNGAISIGVTPNDTYTYTWNTSQTVPNLSGLQAGTYTVTVSAGGNCTAVSNFTVDNNTQSPTISETITPSICSQPNGGINLSVSGGVGPFTYVWSNAAVTEDISGQLAGTYTVTVTGANNCTTTASFTIGNESNNFTIAEGITDNSSCTTTGNGSINLTVAPLGTYTYKWNNNASSEDLSSLLPGTYTVTVTDATGCSIAETYTLANDILPVTLSGSKTDILCFGSNTGQIDVSVDSGTPGYTYNWLPAQPNNPQDVGNIAAGNYAVTVTDAKGCTSTLAFVIGQPSSGIALDCDQSQTVSIPGASDGEGTVGITGGTPPYNIVWSPGGNASNLQPGNFVIPGLTEGSYSVSVTDANGCPLECGFNIGLVDCETEVGTMSANALSLCGNACATATYNSSGQFLDPDDILQFVLHTGSSNAIVNPLARNAQPTFCFNAANMQYGATYYISAVAGTNDGTSNVILSDFCTVVSFGTPVVFYEKPVLDISTPAPLSCANDQSALLVNASPAGGAIIWSTTNGAIVGNPNLANINASQAGIYQAIVTLNGCKDTATVALTDLTNFPQATIQADPSDLLDCKIDQIILAGNIEGTTNANIVWLANGVVYANNNPVQIDQPGTYEFVILDTVSMCADTAIVVINENTAYPPMSILPPTLLTCLQPSAVLSGSSPFPGIVLRWARIVGTDTTILSNGGTYTATQAGTYYLLGLDPANGCRNIESITVNANQSLPLADAGAPFTIDCFGETLPINGSASSASGSFVISWSSSNGNIQAGNNTPTPTITLPGTYTILVTDLSNGCTATDNVIIPPDAPVPAVDVVQPPCFGDRGSITITSVSGGAPPVRYSLNNGPLSTNNQFNNLAGGAYTLLITDAQGCSTTFDTSIVEPTLFDIDIIEDVLVKIADSIFVELDLSVPPSEVASVQWSPSTGLSCDTCLAAYIKPLRTSGYEIVATNHNGCTDRAYINVRVDQRLNIYVPNIFTPDDPNGGDNQWLTIYADPTKGIKIKTFQIFSRWGEKVFERGNFEPNIPTLGWNGRMGNVSLNPAVFVWYAIVIGPAGDEILLEGDVTLMR